MISHVKEISELNKDHVHIKDEVDLLKKINKIIKDGPSNLRIVTDFDYTLTKRFKENGEDVMSSFSVFWECPSILDKYRIMDQELAKTYRVYERDNTLNLNEKTKYMVEWYSEANKNLRGVTLPTAELLDVGRSMVPYLRSGVNSLVSWAEKHSVPVLVFSAGLGPAVKAVMQAGDLMRPNVEVISNFVKVDEDGKISGIDGEIIHTLNKKESAIKKEYYDTVKGRRNVILMGDSIGDADMANAADPGDVVIKVGFLIDKVQENLPKYLDRFDIVLVNDPTVDVVKAITNLMN